MNKTTTQLLEEMQEKYGRKELSFGCRIVHVESSCDYVLAGYKDNFEDSYNFVFIHGEHEDDFGGDIEVSPSLEDIFIRYKYEEEAADSMLEREGYKILGHDLTLLDILVACQNIPLPVHFSTASDGELSNTLYLQPYVYDIEINKIYHDIDAIEWTGNLLRDQSEETILAIYNLLTK